MDKNKIAYIGVKGIIVNSEGKVLITQEPTHYVGGGRWELPGGKIANGEEETPLEDILRREIREELGETFQVQIGKLVDVMRRSWDKPGASTNHIMLAVFECRYLGGDIQLSEENNAFAWVTARELPRYEFIPGYVPVLEKYFVSHPSSETKPDAMRTAEFMRLLHAFQSVERIMYAPNLERMENDVEHSYLLVMLSWYLAHTLGLALDRRKVLEYALIHDLVEVYAGDTPIFDTDAQVSKRDREEAAQTRLAKEWPEFTDLHEAIAQYESQSEPEAVFVYEVDKLVPIITNYVQGGHAWKKHNISASWLFENKRDKIHKRKEIRDLLEQFIGEFEAHQKDFFNEK